MKHPAAVRLGDEVAAALDATGPVVALETAVATHGLPPPCNLQALEEMSSEIRQAGATPAVCVVDEGCFWIGAPAEKAAAAAERVGVEKASVRDLGRCIAQRRSAGLTVSATLFAAQLVGIRVFATGGIGGVHRDMTTSLDVSADLWQLARSPVITVCSGAKSVLDIPRTLEYLETLGVPVVSYQIAEFPAFYLRSSHIPVPMVSSPDIVADMARAHWELGMQSALIVGNPVPREAAIGAVAWAEWLDQAERSAQRRGVHGKDVTPFLLGEVAQLSQGRTVFANLALLRSNARLSGEIARALAA